MTLAQAWAMWDRNVAKLRATRGGENLSVEARIIALRADADAISAIRGLYPVAAIDVGLPRILALPRVPRRRPRTPRADSKARP